MTTGALSVTSIWTHSELVDHVGLPPEGALSPEALVSGTPATFRHIVQYAAVWGIGDDGYRDDLVRQATEVSRLNLQWVAEQCEDALEKWLLGPEIDAQPLSEAYVAFTCMRMAADYASVLR